MNNKLLQTQKNAVLAILQESGVNPLEFKFKEPGKVEPFTVLSHISSAYWFKFGQEIVSFSPAEETHDEFVSNLTWEEKILWLRHWLVNLKREVQAPDMWAALAQEREMLGAEPAGGVNTPFSAEEQAQAKRAIEEIRVYITTTYTLDPKPLAEVNRKLDYLIDAATRLGRIDWKNIFWGTLFGVAAQHLLSSGPGLHDLFGIAGHLIHQLLGGGMPLPPLLH